MLSNIRPRKCHITWEKREKCDEQTCRKLSPGLTVWQSSSTVCTRPSRLQQPAECSCTDTTTKHLLTHYNDCNTLAFLLAALMTHRSPQTPEKPPRLHQECPPPVILGVSVSEDKQDETEGDQVEIFRECVLTLGQPEGL